MADDYLTVLDVAALMRVSEKTVRRLIWAGDLPRINIGRGQSRPRIRIRRSALEQFMAAREKGNAA